MKIRIASVCLSLLSVLALHETAAAQPSEPDPTCETAEPLQDKYQYLRSLSLAIRGTVPTLEEYQALHDLDDVPDSWLEQWLTSADFAAQVARFHESKLWNRVDNRSPYQAFSIGGGGPGQVPASGYHLSSIYRGAAVGCRDEPAEFDANGNIIAEWNEELAAFQEGYVMVSPYWAPDTPIKVCAYNAQEALMSPTGTECGTTASLSDPFCGCGPNLRWCSNSTVDNTVKRSLGWAVTKTIEFLITEERPYTDLFLGNVTYVNGPLVHFWRHFALRGSYLDRNETMLPLALDPATLPNLDYTEVDTWLPVELPPFHAGLFSSPAYLLRFTVNRRRARQFYESFLCKPFLPPSGGLVIDEESAKEPDLQVRPGCSYCHKTLEPAASYWGRWTARGAGFLEPVEYTAFREDCEYCASYGDCSFDCKRHYVTGGFTSKEAAYIGWLKPLQFLEASNHPNLEYGPKLLFQKNIVNGTIAHCTTRNTIDWLSRRTPRPYEADWVAELAGLFAASNYDYRTLVKAIVTDPRFRRSL